MEDILLKIKESAAFLQRNGFSGAKTGIVLGTGLGSFINSMKVEKTISYAEIPHFPVSTVEFHKGNATGFAVAWVDARQTSRH